jgi:hypothetical protein
MHKYKNLIRNLIQHYLNKSFESIEPYRYVVYRTPDDNLCLFEKLSVNNQIGIYTNLSDFDSRILLFILLTLYEKNYLFYEKSYIQDVLYDADITDEDFGLDYMLDNLENNNFDITKWIEFLELVPSKVNFEFDEYDEKNIQDKINYYIEKYGTDIDLIQIYNDRPQISKYFSLKHKQKFYSLEEMMNL